MDLTQAIWDPESLFQIADYDNSDDVQCVGQARGKHGARCRWNISEYDHAEIYTILARLARKSPADVETADLLPLARLCLCKKYHSGQVGEVVRRWQTVVRRAVSYSNASSRESTPQRDTDSMMTGERQRCLTELGEPEDSSITMDLLIRQKISMLTNEIFRLSRELTETKLSLTGAENDGQELRRNFQASQEQLRKSREYAHGLAEKIRKIEAEHQNVLSQRSAELTDAKKHLEESMGNEAKHRISISKLQEEVEKLKEEASKEKKSREDHEKSLLKIIDRLSETLNQHEQDLKSTQSFLDNSREDNAKLKAENSSVKKEIDAAQESLNGMRDDCARLTAALASKTKSLQQSQTELEVSREAKMQLEREVQALSERITVMNKPFNQEHVVETKPSEADPSELKARRHGCFGIWSVWRSRRRGEPEARPPVN